MNASGSGAINFDNNGSIAFSGTGVRTLILSGSNTEANALAARIGDDPSSNATSLTKTGAGVWILSNANTYTGTTTVFTGELRVNGITAAASAVSVSTGGTLGGSGAVYGPVSIDEGGAIKPGNDGAGTLSSGALTLNNTSVLYFELGASKDSIKVDGNLVLDGTLNVTALAGFSAGTYCLITYSGSLVDNSLIIGTVPGGYAYTISTGSHKVILSVDEAYRWDISNSAGFQAGNGTWGTDNYWSLDGTILTSWPGAGNAALFSGTDGTYSVIVNGTQSVDNFAFQNSGYTLNGGVINLDGSSGINVENGKNAVVNSNISGSTGLVFSGGGTLTLTGDNSYTGATSINAGLLIIDALANGGASCPLGASGNAAINLILDNAVLRYTGGAVSTDRLFTVGSNGCTIDGSGSGGLNFNNSGSIISSGAGSRTLTLSGSAGNNKIVSIISDDATSNPTSITKTGTGEWILSGVNTFTGALTISAGTLSAGTIKDGGFACNLGAFTNDAVNLAINGGTLKYAGNGDNSDRLFSLGTNGGTLDASGNGALVFTNTDPLEIAGTGTRTITIAGSNTGQNTLAASIDNDVSANATSVTKSGTGRWVLSGVNTYTGNTTVSSGTLYINGSTAAGSAVKVNGGILGGCGNAAGTVTVAAGAAIAPGNGSEGTLATGKLILNNTSALNFELGALGDSIKVTGNLTLDGILNVTGSSGFDQGTYCLITYTGTLTNNGLQLGILPSGYDYELSALGGKVELTATAIKMNPLYVIQTAARCTVYTDNWTIVFDNGAGGGITTLTDAAHGAQAARAIRLVRLRTFTIFLTVKKIKVQRLTEHGRFCSTKTLHVIIRQSGTIAGLPYISDYTIHGSGKMYIKTTLHNHTAGNIVNKTVQCMTERRPVISMSVYKGNNNAESMPLCASFIRLSKQTRYIAFNKRSVEYLRRCIKQRYRFLH